MASAFSIEFIELTSDFQTPLTFELVDKTQSVGIYFLNQITMKFLINKLLEFVDIFTFPTPAPVALVLANMTHHYDVMCERV